MESLQAYKQFAKTKETNIMTNNVVIYTRVSSKEQAESNASLDTQLKYCKEYALRKNFNIVDYFGGTYESAKSDERKEFNKMLTFLKRRKNISYILVYSYDRFSRTGANAAYISSNLKKRGIHTLSVSQDVDTSKPSGVFQENLYYMFSQFDNELRKDKSVTGMKEKLRKGYWCFVAPVGYINTNTGSTADKSNYILNKKGKMLKLAFKWIHNYGWNLERVAEETGKRGVYISTKRLSGYLRNPFYAGLITSSIIPNEIYEGKQEKAVSYKVFKEVNEILDGKSSSRKGIKNKKINEEIPLRGLLICDDCGVNMTAYKASKNQKYYYKCNTKGCKNNQRAEEVHESFKEILSYFQIDKKYIEPLKISLQNTFLELNKENETKRSELSSNLKNIELKLEKLEEKFLFEGVSQEIYHKHLTRLTNEKNEILKEFEKPEIKLSNLEKFIEFSTNISSNLLNIWDKQDHSERVDIQKMLFPNGIRYNRKKQHYRTQRVNSLFALNGNLSNTYMGAKKRGETILNDFSSEVELEGIEPSSKQVPKMPSTCLVCYCFSKIT